MLTIWPLYFPQIAQNLAVMNPANRLYLARVKVKPKLVKASMFSILGENELCKHFFNAKH